MIDKGIFFFSEKGTLYLNSQIARVSTCTREWELGFDRLFL